MFLWPVLGLWGVQWLDRWPASLGIASLPGHPKAFQSKIGPSSLSGFWSKNLQQLVLSKSRVLQSPQKPWATLGKKTKHLDSITEPHSNQQHCPDPCLEMEFILLTRWANIALETKTNWWWVFCSIELCFKQYVWFCLTHLEFFWKKLKVTLV